MSSRKKIRQPTPDDIWDLHEFHQEIVNLIISRDPDKHEYIVPSMTYIMAISLATREDLHRQIEELETLWEIFYKKKKDMRKKNNGSKDV